ncbi:hypothetical protein KY349_02120 [Candidatus Woesearchaeota archaeon]|nr:hypothetical protein [Candidatus Woesearchaeota archaeon]
MIFRKKKDKEMEKLGLKDEEILEFKEFEDIPEEKEIKSGEFEKNFIFHIDNGCPICASDVKGNDYYRYFCEKCNVLFDKKDIIEAEFGKRPGHVRKTSLTEDEKEELEKKRKELKDRIYKTFSEEQKKELIEEAEEEKEEEAEPEEEPEEVEAEVIPPPKLEEAVEAEPEEAEPEEEPETEEAEPEETAEETEKREEYDLEEPEKIIASTESTKMHKGDCHFVKKIHPENRIYLDSIDDGEEKGYEMCVCLRRLKAMQR